MNFKVFDSQSSVLPPYDQTGSQAATREPDPSDGPHDLDERFLDVIVDFKLRNATGEFPTVSVCVWVCSFITFSYAAPISCLSERFPSPFWAY